MDAAEARRKAAELAAGLIRGTLEDMKAIAESGDEDAWLLYEAVVELGSELAQRSEGRPDLSFWSETLTVASVRYGYELFEMLGGLLPLDAPFRVVSRDDGRIVLRLDQPERPAMVPDPRIDNGE